MVVTLALRDSSTLSSTLFFNIGHMSNIRHLGRYVYIIRINACATLLEYSY